MDKISLRNEYTPLSNDEKFQYEVIAEANLTQASFLHSKINELLKV